MENFHCEPDTIIQGELTVEYAKDNPLRANLLTDAGDLIIEGIRLIRKGDSWQIKVKNGGLWGHYKSYGCDRVESKDNNPILYYLAVRTYLKHWGETKENIPLSEECKVILMANELKQ